MKVINVVCGVVYSEEGKVFLARKAEVRPHEGKWEFPGGKVEPGEDSVTALKRELIEELDMESEVLGFVGTTTFISQELTIKLDAYACRLIRFGEKFTDHDAFMWVIPDRLMEYELSEADVPLAQMVSEMNQ